MPPGTPDEVQPPAEPLQHGFHPEGEEFRPSFHAPTDLRPRKGRLSSARRAALWAGVIAGIGSLVPFAPFIFLCMIAAGGMSVAFYSRREPDVEVRASLGMKLGALAGFFGFVMNAILSSLGMLSMETRSALRSQLASRLQEAVASSKDAATTDMLQKLGEQLNTTGGLLTLFAIALAALGLFFVLFGGLGGAIGASLFGRRKT
ncbi:MAG: hypothetical protein ACM3JB_08115 [Acidobacteriaceae bacterium]